MSHGKPYTEGEDFLILDRLDLTAAEIGQILGRSFRSVQKRRGQLRGAEGIHSFREPGKTKGRQHAQPWKVGSRILIAKTCNCCGRLLNSSWYRRYSTGRWYEECLTCERNRSRERHAMETSEQVDRKRSHERELQRITADRATRSWQPYTEVDLAVFSDSRKSMFQMALETSRTLGAVRNARQRYGLTDEVEIGQPDEARWIIRLPDVQAA